MKPTLLILAAGMGSRYGNLKQLDKLGPNGETILDYSVFDAIRAGFGKVVFVIRRDFENEFREIIISKIKSNIEVTYVLQELDMLPDGHTCPEERKKPWGTGHAILMAEKAINEPFAVINADDFYGFDAFKVISKFLSDLDMNSKGDFAMVGYELRHTLSEFGAVSRGICSLDKDGFLKSVEERTHILKQFDKIGYQNDENETIFLDAGTVVSMNFWGFSPYIFHHLKEQFIKFLQTNSGDPKSEFYIPKVVSHLINSKQATVKVLNTSSVWFGLTYMEDRQSAVERIAKLTNQKIYPLKLW